MVKNIAILLEMFSILLCLFNVFGKQLVFSIYTVVLVISNLFLFMGINDYGFQPYISFLPYVLTFCYCLKLFKQNVKTTLINCFITIIVIGVLQLILETGAFYIWGAYRNQTKPDEILINAGCLAVIAILYKKINLKKLSDFLLCKNKLLKFIFFSIVLFAGWNILHIKKLSNINNVELIQIVYFVILFLSADYEWQKVRSDAERKKVLNEMDRLYYAAYDELILLIRERQHDMKNHISAILGMIYTTDNYEELVLQQKNYCQDIMKQNAESRLLLSIESPLIAGFIYSKIQEAKQQKIEVEYTVALGKLKAKVSEYELIEMIGILFDNAAEAVISNGEAVKRIILKLTENDKEIQISLANSSKIFSPNEISKFFQKDYTSKGEGHGIGLKKLKKMVKKQNGEIIVANNKDGAVNYIEFNVILPKKMGRGS